ncbi:sulfite exporter TauE/SafE family protein [Paenibacillus sp. ACRRY]|uniref:sulfite exporter TauE/SafE family protein n=1 Tax=Paenibacillus sp. ACRRY TaxID=2918208 RepID=UPI001EF52405|nr:sulfite exporter TauE/SafE family protein [Paenibacillus sp. ACRRY]MCG7381676.1 sulfite exporter TauE/SafE family protein [Paenibacillus sp. ACRRY]
MGVGLAGILILFAVLSGLAKVGFGFGAGMILNPILTLFVSSATATTLLAPILWFSNFTGARVHRASIQWGLIARMLPMALTGTLFGSIILAYVDDHILKPAIGISAIMMGVMLIASRKRKDRAKNREATADLADNSPLQEKSTKKTVLYQLGALASGFVGAAANSGGLPLIVLFLHDSSFSKKQFTANIAMLLAVMDSIKIVSYLVLGTLSIQNLLLVLLFIPFIYAGGFAGKWLNEKISETSFLIVVHSIIFITGILLLY